MVDWIYQVKQEQFDRLETIGERDGHQAAGGDGCPEDTGQVSCSLMRQRQWLRHTIGVHKAGVDTLTRTKAGYFFHVYRNQLALFCNHAPVVILNRQIEFSFSNFINS